MHARYIVACDGAHSWVREQLNVQTDAVSEESTWGVLDIVPITDFRMIHHFPQETSNSDQSSSGYPSILLNQFSASWEHHDGAKREQTRSILHSSSRL